MKLVQKLSSFWIDHEYKLREFNFNMKMINSHWD